MSQQLHQAMAAGNLAEAGTLALALAQLGELAIIDLIGLASLLSAQGKTEQTIALYQLWLEHCDSPLEYVAWYNLAVVLLQAGDEAGAERGYRQSLKLHPGFTESQLGLGGLLERRRQPEAALAQWRAALDDLDNASAAAPALRIRLYNNIGRLAEAQGDLPQAEQALLHSLQLDPRQSLIAPLWLNLRLKLCAWPVYGFVPGLSESALRHATSALAMLSLSDDPARQLAAAQREVRATQPPAPAPLADGDGYSHRKLRIGYLSNGFGAQPIGRMLAELFELHNREQIEVYGFCWTPEDGSALRQRLLRGMDLHVPIATLTDTQAAQAIRAHEIDILVDLHGRLPGARPGILLQRPAPVQIAWLSQPGTSAMAAIDYVLADAVTLPPALAPHYTEQPLYLPQCYLPQDRRRPLPSSAPGARAAYGLPQPGFVYCCFSAPGQITPERYATWMRILHQVPDSVLVAASGWRAGARQPAGGGHATRHTQRAAVLCRSGRAGAADGPLPGRRPVPRHRALCGGRHRRRRAVGRPAAADQHRPWQRQPHQRQPAASGRAAGTGDGQREKIRSEGGAAGRASQGAGAAAQPPAQAPRHRAAVRHAAAGVRPGSAVPAGRQGRHPRHSRAGGTVRRRGPYVASRPARRGFPRARE